MFCCDKTVLVSAITLVSEMSPASTLFLRLVNISDVTFSGSPVAGSILVCGLSPNFAQGCEGLSSVIKFVSITSI